MLKKTKNNKKIKNFIGILLKILSREELSSKIDCKVVKYLINGAIGLLKHKSNIKILGIKIGSFLQHYNDQQIISEQQILRKEMLRCMCCDESKEIRKLAITNIQMNDENFEELIMRTREIDGSLRLTIYIKLVKEQILLENKDLGSIYKVVYDGLYSRDELVRKQCVNYLKMNYCRFVDNKTHKQTENHNNSEEIPLDIKKKRFSSPKKLEMYQEIREQILRFFRIFCIENTLFYPHLYEMLEVVCKEFVQNVIKMEDLSFYLQDFLRHRMNNPQNITNEEIFLLRYLCSLYQEGLDSHQDLEEIFLIIDEHFPNGCVFSQIISEFHKNQRLFALYQSLLLAEMLINCDELGRNSILETLKAISLDLQPITQPFPIVKGKENDLFYRVDEEMLQTTVFSQGYFETPVIRDFEDLICIIVRIARKIIGEENHLFSVQIIQIISELREPLENDTEIMENEDNLQRKLKRNKKQLETLNTKIQEASQNIKEIKKNKAKNPQTLQEMQDKYEFFLNQKKELTRNCEEIENLIEKTDVRCLQLAKGLLQKCRLSLKEAGISSLLASFIYPLLQSSRQHIKNQALECMALYVLLDREVCLEYFDVFTLFFDDEITEKPNNTQIISLKLIFDFFMVYKYPTSSGKEKYDIEDIMSHLSRFMFKGDLITQKLCIEGFCRLLFNDKLEEIDKILANLILIWNNSLMAKRASYESLQILSAFFRNYVAMSLKHLENYEKALEIVVDLNIHMMAKQYEFNHEYIFYDFNEMSSLSSTIKNSINLMSYSFNKDFQNLKEFYENDSNELILFPQERFFLYMMRTISVKNSTKIMALFEQQLVFFDFLGNCKSKIALLLIKSYIDKAMEKVPDLQKKKVFAKYLKKLDSEENKTDEQEDQEIFHAIQSFETSMKESKGLIPRYFKELLDWGLMLRKDEKGELTEITGKIGEEEILMDFEAMNLKELKENKEEIEEDNEEEKKEKNKKTRNTKRKMEEVIKEEEERQGENLNGKRMTRTRRKI